MTLTDAGGRRWRPTLVKIINGAGLYLMGVEDSVFAYLKTEDAVFGGAGKDVTEAVSDVMLQAFPEIDPNVFAAALLELPAIDQIDRIG